MGIASPLDQFEDKLRTHFLKYTRKAYELLPKIDEPRILDIGCGTGMPSIELVRLSNGHVTGLDTDKSLLARFEQRLAEAGLEEHVTIMAGSMFDMHLKFPEESFDIIWNEGAIFPIGFKRGLIDWRRFLKPNGFLVLHDATEDLKEKLRQIPECGYRLVTHFLLPEDAWWSEYYQPFEERLPELYETCRDDPATLKILNKKRVEIEKVKRDPAGSRSVFIILQRAYQVVSAQWR